MKDACILDADFSRSHDGAFSGAARDTALSLPEEAIPTIDVLSPLEGEYAVQNRILVRMTSPGDTTTVLMHNGKEVKDNLVKTRIPGFGIRPRVHTYAVTLERGVNTFSAQSRGKNSSIIVQKDVYYDKIAPDAVLYVFAVGINRYKNRVLDLNYARKDAEAFVSLVTDTASPIFARREVMAFYDSAATSANICSKLDEMAAKIRPQDMFLFYYAGHGSYVDQRYYFVTSENTRLYDREKLDANALYAITLQEKLRAIKAQKQVVVIDACHSGAATAMLTFRGAGVEKTLVQLSRSAGVHVLASSGVEQYANETQKLSHGSFTYVVLDGLKGSADRFPQDNVVTVNELSKYLDEQVPIVTQKYNGEAQYPVTASTGQDFPLVFLPTRTLP